MKTNLTTATEYTLRDLFSDALLETYSSGNLVTYTLEKRQYVCPNGAVQSANPKKLRSLATWHNLLGAISESRESKIAWAKFGHSVGFAIEAGRM